MTKGNRTRKYKIKATKAIGTIPEEANGFEMVKCQSCNGTGIQEFEHGLISRNCPKCEGKGKIKVRIKVPAEVS